MDPPDKPHKTPGRVKIPGVFAQQGQQESTPSPPLPRRTPVSPDPTEDEGELDATDGSQAAFKPKPKNAQDLAENQDPVKSQGTRAASASVKPENGQDPKEPLEPVEPFKSQAARAASASVKPENVQDHAESLKPIKSQATRAASASVKPKNVQDPAEVLEPLQPIKSQATRAASASANPQQANTPSPPKQRRVPVLEGPVEDTTSNLDITDGSQAPLKIVPFIDERLPQLVRPVQPQATSVASPGEDELEKARRRSQRAYIADRLDDLVDATAASVLSDEPRAPSKKPLERNKATQRFPVKPLEPRSQDLNKALPKIPQDNGPEAPAKDEATNEHHVLDSGSGLVGKQGDPEMVDQGKPIHPYWSPNSKLKTGYFDTQGLDQGPAHEHALRGAQNVVNKSEGLLLGNFDAAALAAEYRSLFEDDCPWAAPKSSTNGKTASGKKADVAHKTEERSTKNTAGVPAKASQSLPPTIPSQHLSAAAPADKTNRADNKSPITIPPSPFESQPEHTDLSALPAPLSFGSAKVDRSSSAYRQLEAFMNDFVPLDEDWPDELLDLPLTVFKEGLRAMCTRITDANARLRPLMADRKALRQRAGQLHPGWSRWTKKAEAEDEERVKRAEEASMGRLVDGEIARQGNEFGVRRMVRTAMAQCERVEGVKGEMEREVGALKAWCRARDVERGGFGL